MDLFTYPSAFALAEKLSEIHSEISDKHDPARRVLLNQRAARRLRRGGTVVED